MPVYQRSPAGAPLEHPGSMEEIRKESTDLHSTGGHFDGRCRPLDYSPDPGESRGRSTSGQLGQSTDDVTDETLWQNTSIHRYCHGLLVVADRIGGRSDHGVGLVSGRECTPVTMSCASVLDEKKHTPQVAVSSRPETQPGLLSVRDKPAAISAHRKPRIDPDAPDSLADPKRMNNAGRRATDP